MSSFNRSCSCGFRCDVWFKCESFGIVPLGDQWISTDGVYPYALLMADYRVRGVAWQIVVNVLLADIMLVIPLMLSHTLSEGYVPKGIALQ